MVVESCNFNSERDLQAVEQFGFLDLKDAFVNGVVETDLASTDIDYNGIEDPDAVLGRPRDVFDAMQARMNLDLAEMQKSSNEAKSE